MHPEIAEVTISTDESSVSSIEITYRVNGILVPAVRHEGSSAKGKNLRTSTLKLAPGEKITEISGKSSEVITYLKIVSSSGQSAEIGGYAGLPFANIVPSGSRVLGFAGGVNGHLHNLYVYLA